MEVIIFKLADQKIDLFHVTITKCNVHYILL